MEPSLNTTNNHGNKSNTSGNLGNDSVMSSGDIDGSYLSLPSSQLSKVSFCCNGHQLTTLDMLITGLLQCLVL